MRTLSILLFLGASAIAQQARTGTSFPTTAFANPTVATPVITPATGTYASAQTVTITESTSGANIYYTTDGSTPSCSGGGTSTLYTGSFSTGYSPPQTTVVNALGCLYAWNTSATATATYTLVAATVIYDNANSTAGNLGAVTSTSFSLTLNAASNMGVVVAVAESVNNSGTLTVSVGGTSASLVSGTDSSTALSFRTRMYCVALGSTTGAQTVSVSGMTSNDPVIGAVSFSGVNQTAPCSGGAATGAVASGARTLTITSATNDQVVWEASGASAFSSPTQTQRWTIFNNFTTRGVGETAAGASTVTGGWTLGGFGVISGLSVNHL